MRKSQETLIDEYNHILMINKQVTRAVKWAYGKLELSNGVLLTPPDIKAFRSHIKSRMLCTHIDRLYGACDNRGILIKEIQREYASIKNKEYWKSLDPDVAENKREHMRTVQKMVDYSAIVFPEPWNKGKTKHDDSRLLKNSKDRTGSNNPMYGHTWSEEQKHQKSEWVKERIERGVWTPHVHNSRTHWNCTYNGKQYRSSWEAMYASLNPNDEYEVVRIPYVLHNARRIYIVDFCNHLNKTLTEIKPTAHTITEEYCAKVKSAEEWCLANGYTFNVVTEHYFVYNYNNILFDELNIPNIREKLARIKSEANKQNTDN